MDSAGVHIRYEHVSLAANQDWPLKENVGRKLRLNELSRSADLSFMEARGGSDVDLIWEDAMMRYIRASFGPPR